MAEIYMAAAEMMISRRTKPVEINVDEALTSIRTGDVNNPEVFSNICINLGSTIETAIVMKAVPSSSYLHQLLFIAKEVYSRRTKFLQPWLMLLMLPLKDACQVGWFLDGDKDDLLMMENEVRYGFCDTNEMSTEQSNAHSCVSNIVSRFYPTMKVEKILTTLDVKAGSATFFADFHISLDTLPTHCQNLYLLVARVDNIDTSACIVRPSNVRFLINNYEVRSSANIDVREPQLPSNVTLMMKNGVNRLQVRGEVDANSGQYIIAVAFMNSIPCPDPPQLQDYVYFISLGDDSDCEIIEMPTQISLYCPISQLRIRTPVKGHLCEHRQCFDYNYFIEINAVRPNWKCPLCNKQVCNLDIRIDQEFLKILNEVAKGVSDVTISPDGSWWAGNGMAEKGSTETRRRTKTPKNRVPDIDGNLISKEASISFPTSSLDSRNSGGSAVKVGVERPSSTSTTPAVSPPTSSFVQSSNVPVHNTPPSVKHNSGGSSGSAINVSAERPTPAVSPPPFQAFRDSRLQSQGSHDPVYNTLPSVKQTKNHLNRVHLTPTPPPNPFTKPNHPSAESRPHIATPPNLGTSNTKKARTTPLFTPIQLPPSSGSSNSPESISERVMRLTRRGHQLFTPAQSQPTPVPASAEAPVPASAEAPASTSAQAPALTSPQAPASAQAPTCSSPQARASTPVSKTRQPSPTRSQEPNGEMPFGKMRGSLRGTELEAAKLQFGFGQTHQPVRANQPMSLVPVPTPTPPELLIRQQQPSTNSGNVSNLGN